MVNGAALRYANIVRIAPWVLLCILWARSGSAAEVLPLPQPPFPCSREGERLLEEGRPRPAARLFAHSYQRRPGMEICLWWQAVAESRGGQLSGAQRTLRLFLDEAGEFVPPQTQPFLQRFLRQRESYPWYRRPWLWGTLAAAAVAGAGVATGVALWQQRVPVVGSLDLRP